MQLEQMMYEPRQIQKTETEKQRVYRVEDLESISAVVLYTGHLPPMGPGGSGVLPPVGGGGGFLDIPMYGGSFHGGSTSASSPSLFTPKIFTPKTVENIGGFGGGYTGFNFLDGTKLESTPKKIQISDSESGFPLARLDFADQHKPFAHIQYGGAKPSGFDPNRTGEEAESIFDYILRTKLGIDRY